MAAPINVLVAGLGLIGERHARHVAAHPLTRLAGVIDPDPARRAAIAAPSFAALDQVDVAADAIIIATPTATHAAIGTQAAERGLAVLMEKPIAHDLDQADALIAACKAANVPLLVGHHRRHHACVQDLRALIEGGAIGRPVGVSGIWSVRKPDPYFQVDWRSGLHGSPVYLNLVHDLDFLRFVLGEIAEVSATLSSAVRGRATEDSGALSLRFANGALGSILFSDTAPSPWAFEVTTAENPNIAASEEDCYRFLGTEGAIAFPSLTRFNGSLDWGQAQTKSLASPRKLVPLDAQLGHLHDIITTGAAPICSGEDGRRALELALQVTGHV